MANLWFLIDCNTFWDIFATTELWPNLDPRSPYLSPKYFKTYKKIMGTSYKTLFFNIWESEILILLEGMWPNVLKLVIFGFLKVLKLLGPAQLWKSRKGSWKGSRKGSRKGTTEIGCRGGSRYVKGGIQKIDQKNH